MQRRLPLLQPAGKGEAVPCVPPGLFQHFGSCEGRICPLAAHGGMRPPPHACPRGTPSLLPPPFRGEEKKPTQSKPKNNPQTPRSPLNPINSFACSRLNSFQPPPAAPGGVPPTSTSCFLFFSGFFSPVPPPFFLLVPPFSPFSPLFPSFFFF